MTSPLSPEAVAQMVADRAAGTPGPWASKAMGGSSTVLADQMPSRNDTRIPAYGYREENGFCLSYPFIEDDGRTRLDFTCFSHSDARRIARLPDLEAAYLTLAAENATLRASEAAALDRAEKAEAELKDLIGAIVQVEGGLNRDCDMAWAGQIQDGAREHSRRLWGRFTAARDEVSAHTRFAWCAEIQADKARRRDLTPTTDKEPKT